jgi:cell division protein FtsL
MPVSEELLQKQTTAFNPESVMYDRNAVRAPLSAETLVQPSPVRQPRPVEIPEKLPRVVEEPAPALRRKVNLFYVAVLLVAAVLLCQIISMHSEITALSLKASKIENAVQTLEKEQSSLNLRITQKMNMMDIRKYAEDELGMYAPQSKDIRFIGENGENFYVAQPQPEKPEVITVIWNTIENIVLKAWSFVN